MRLLSWLLCVTATFSPVISSEDKNISRPKRGSSEKKIVCYYTNWSVYRPGTAKFSPQNINPYLCTHLIYAFGGLSKENALKPFDKYQDIEQGGYAKFNGLKTYNKNLKTMLAIGGWNEGSARFSPLVADEERRRDLVKNTVKFLRQNHFDGLDLDWEYPSFRDGGKPRDRDNYATLVQEFREEFERESEKTGRPRLLLTMAVPAGIEYIDKGYDVPKLNKYLDWMNILSYDYHSAFEPTINHHSPLFSMEEDDEYNFDAQLNIDYTVQHYIKLGADKSKLVLGIPTYGRSYTLFNPDATDIGSPADGPGEQGEATREKGYLAYYEICERVKSGGWTIENPNPEAMGPYAFKDNQWVGFDDEDIARAKAKYVNDNDLGGIMFWSIDNDDFRGKCHGKPYPIIEAAKEALLASANELLPSSGRSGSSRSNSKQEQETTSKTKPRKTRLRTKSSTTTESSRTKSSGRTSTTPQPPTTPDPGSDFVCKDEGFFPHPRDCKKYFWCLDSGPSSLGIVAHQFTCPSGLVFNKISDSCDYPRNVICKTKSEASTTTTSTTPKTTTLRTTTIRNRLVITASPPKTTTTTTTTTTEQPDEEEDTEHEEEEEEEDPGTIKELINLIKKLGGVEQLEKQLNLQNSDEKEKIKPSLYSRVLQGRTANRYRGVNEESSSPKYVSVFRNRPVGPQSPATEESITSTRGSEKPRYVTIQRNRTTKKPSKVEEQSEEKEEIEVIEPKAKEETFKPFRRRPSTDGTTEKEYVVLKRNRPQKEEEEVSSPKYKSIVRVRSTTEATTEEEENSEDEKVSEGEEEEEEEEKEEEVEEEVIDGDEKEETEPGQKLKKYSAIIRDNKKVVSDEEESKVSGPQGPHYGSGAPSSTTETNFEERNNVNNVNTVTSPRYVEIRRTQPPSTESSETDVNNVNNSYINESEKREIINETNQLSETNPEGREYIGSSFQRRITTEIVRKPITPSIKLSTLERTTSTPEVTSKGTEVTRFRGRFRSGFSLESTSTLEVRPTINYRTLNRNNFEKPVLLNDRETNQLPESEKTFKTSIEDNFSTGIPRRFQFAPRTKPTVLFKPFESTTEAFTITVPDLPDSRLTENILESSSDSPFPSVTLEPKTTTTQSFVDNTVLHATENDVILTTFGGKRVPLSTRYRNPTTSTQTSVVTSITESSFTERKKISVPKKSRFKSSSRYASQTTTEESIETTKPFYRSTGYKTITRSRKPEVETLLETGKRRFRSRSTTSTTTEEPEKKYVGKKTRAFKKIITEAPQVTSTTTERVRFRPRIRSRQSEDGLNTPLYSKLNNGRRSTNFSKKEEDEDDLEVEQTATFFGDDIENSDRFILGGSVRQTSEKDYLTADVILKTVPTVEEEEENLSGKTSEELTNSLTKTAKPLRKKINTKEPLKNTFLTINPNLRKLRTRTRPQKDITTESINIANNLSQATRTNETISNNAITPNPNLNNFRHLRTRTRQNNNQTIFDSLNDEENKKEPIRSNFFSSGTRILNTTVLKNKISAAAEDSGYKKTEESNLTEGFGTKEPNRFISYTSNPNLSNFRNLRAKVKEDYGISNRDTTSSIDTNTVEKSSLEELDKKGLAFPNIRRQKNRNEQLSRTTEAAVGSTSGGSISNNFRERNSRTRGNQTYVNSKKTESLVFTVSSVPTRTTKGSTVTTSSQYKFRNFKNEAEENRSKEVTASSKTDGSRLTENISNNLITNPDESFLKTQGGHYILKSTESTITTPTGTTYGAKLRSTPRSTVGSTVLSPDDSSADSSIQSTASTSQSESTKFGAKTTLSTIRSFQPNLKSLRIKAQYNEVTQPIPTYTGEHSANQNALFGTSSPNYSSRSREITTTTPSSTKESQDPGLSNITVSNYSQSNFEILKAGVRGTVRAPESINLSVTETAVNETLEKENRNGRGGFPKERRKVLVRARPVKPTQDTKDRQEENELESPEEPSIRTSGKKGTQEYFTNLRSRGRSTTQSPTTSERVDRRRTQLDRRRFRTESKSTTPKPEIQTETSLGTTRSTFQLRRRIRPSTSTTTTEETYNEQQEDSTLEESKSLDETPDIQDLADPAVVAIHNLAKVSPGPIGGPVITSPLNAFSQTPATYTVHVTPSDIASFTTSTRVAAVTPGSIPSRTSILTLKPFTVPVITKQYITKQTPLPARTPSPFRGTGISVVTEEPYSPRSEILLQSRQNQDTSQRTKATPSITSTVTQKETASKPRRVKPFSKVSKQEVIQSVSSPEPPVDYEYYDDDEDPLANIPASALKVKVHSDGYIECLDRGNFPHPFSCKKFISCAKMENNELLGWEYTCPKHLSFDPVGGICNWSAGLGCQH